MSIAVFKEKKPENPRGARRNERAVHVNKSVGIVLQRAEQSQRDQHAGHRRPVRRSDWGAGPVAFPVGAQALHERTEGAEEPRAVAGHHAGHHRPTHGHEILSSQGSKSGPQRPRKPSHMS